MAATIEQKSLQPNLLFSKEPPLPPILSQTQHQQLAPDESINGSGFTKLTNVEAQRIMSVLNEIQKKAILIGFLPDHVEKRLSTVFSGEILIGITEHQKIEKKYKTLLELKLNSDATGATGDSLANEIREASKQVRNSTRSLYRLFVSHDAASTNKLRYLRTVKTPAVTRFEELIQEVRILVYDRLRTTVEEERARQDKLSVIIAKEQKTSNEVKLLKEEVETARRERSNEISKKNEVIRKLKEDLRQIKLEAEETTKRLESRSKQKEDNDLQKFLDKEISLKREIESLKFTCLENLKKNREEEDGLRKKKFKIESEVENWIHKYDQDMEEKQTEIDDITAIFTEEKAQLSELQERYKSLQGEYEKIMEQRKIEGEKKRLENEKMKRLIVAVTLIQSMFRGWKIRRDLKKKKSSITKEKKKKGK